MATAAVQPPARAGPPGQPDIGYAPDYDNYLARIRRRQETEHLASTLPPGFPTRLRSELVWDGNNVTDSYEWNYRLTKEDLGEIDAALQHFKGTVHCPSAGEFPST